MLKQDNNVISSFINEAGEEMVHIIVNDRLVKTISKIGVDKWINDNYPGEKFETRNMLNG